MRTINKIIMSGLTAFLMSCSEDSTSPDYTGATTEPSTSPIANLTEEQRAILARSFEILVDSTKLDSLKAILGTEVTADNYRYFNIIPISVKNDQFFSYPSKDGRKVCDVVTFSQESKPRVDRKGVFRAMSYDVHGSHCYLKKMKGNEDYWAEVCSGEEDYAFAHSLETYRMTKIIDVDGVPVIMNTVGKGGSESFFGYGVSCGEYLKEFKQSCSASNGLFLDLGDACNMNDLSLACASFIPEGKTPDEVLNSYTEGYKIQCLEDSIKYAPYDDENYVYHDPYSDSLYMDSLYRASNLVYEWSSAQKHSMYAYRWQFSIIDSTVGVDEFDNFVYQEREDDELALKHVNSLGFAYNTLPDTKIADAYRKEGVYVLPDSLVAEFFPNLATYPTGLDGLKWYPPEIVYIIVLKDVGAKGHLLTNFDANGIYVTDIVKSGNCPEDTTVHYSVFLLMDSPDWDVMNRPIVKTTYVSDNWNCDKPETLEKIEPYGEWTISFDGSNYYEEWFSKFETDRYVELYGGKERFIELFGEENYLKLVGKE
ncbi:hypothetical protein [Fibrobacter sp.]|uniref:hypothetical protein n=1 Tax=Fibrobacter sp. TaxID=35828 RepID=UPI00386E1B3B